LDSQWLENVDVTAFQKLVECCRLVSLSFILPLLLCLSLLQFCFVRSLPFLLLSDLMRLKLIIRTGLSRPSQIKWLLTSRPLDSAERELLTGSDQVRVDLELNTKHISRGVNGNLGQAFSGQLFQASFAHSITDH
jgi:hypothetical protein